MEGLNDAGVPTGEPEVELVVRGVVEVSEGVIGLGDGNFDVRGAAKVRGTVKEVAGTYVSSIEAFAAVAAKLRTKGTEAPRDGVVSVLGVAKTTGVVGSPGGGPAGGGEDKSTEERTGAPFVTSGIAKVGPDERVHGGWFARGAWFAAWGREELPPEREGAKQGNDGAWVARTELEIVDQCRQGVVGACSLAEVEVEEAGEGVGAEGCRGEAKDSAGDGRPVGVESGANTPGGGLVSYGGDASEAKGPGPRRTKNSSGNG